MFNPADLFSLKDIFSVSLILFSIIDILGALPVILEIRKKAGGLHSGQATAAAGAIMIAFLFLGQSILKLFGLDIESFALAGAIVIFLMGLEMILDRNIFKNNHPTPDDAQADRSHNIVPIAFPIIAGAGTMTTIISLRAQYSIADILVGILVNLVFVYLVLRSSGWIEARLGRAGSQVLRKIFGMILLAISIKLIKTYFTIHLP